MRGLKARELEAVLDFIYQGETNIFQEDLEAFLLIAEELQLKGLVGEKEEPLKAGKDLKMKVETLSENANSPQYKETKYKEPDQFENFGALLSTGQQGEQLVPNKDVARSVNDMIVKQDTFWTCTVCQFKSMNRSHLKEHVETHIEGLEFPCNFCGKITRSSNAFRQHIGKFHKSN